MPARPRKMHVKERRHHRDEIGIDSRPAQGTRKLLQRHQFLRGVHSCGTISRRRERCLNIGIRRGGTGYWSFRRPFFIKTGRGKKGAFLRYHACGRSFRERLFEQDLLTRLKVSWLLLFLLATLPLQPTPFGRFFTSLSRVSNFREMFPLFFHSVFPEKLLLGRTF